MKDTTARPDTIRLRSLARIHILAKELALTDPAYRNVLFAVSGHRSAKDMTNLELQHAVAILARHQAKREAQAHRDAEIVTDEEALAILG